MSDLFLTMKCWIGDGGFHKEVFPASTLYKPDGEVLSYRYYCRGNDITVEVEKYLKENGLTDRFDIPEEHQLIMKMKFW